MSPTGTALFILRVLYVYLHYSTGIRVGTAERIKNGKFNVSPSFLARFFARKISSSRDPNKLNGSRIHILLFTNTCTLYGALVTTPHRQTFVGNKTLGDRFKSVVLFSITKRAAVKTTISNYIFQTDARSADNDINRLSA